MIHTSKLIPSVQQVGLIKTKLKAVYWEMEAPALLVDSKVYEFDLRKAIWFTSSGPICISLHFIAMLGFVQDLLHLKGKRLPVKINGTDYIYVKLSIYLPMYQT